jgi:PAS domain S-box-containing protein
MQNTAPTLPPVGPQDQALLSWIQQFAPYGVITLDESLRIRTWNHWLEVHSGWRGKDVAGKKLFELFPDLLERKLTGPFERALQGESSVLSTALHHYLLPLRSTFPGAGTERMRQTARVAPLFEQGKPSGIVVVIEDVTQRESQAEALERQHRRDALISWALAHLLKTDQPRKSVRQLFFKIAEHLDLDTFLVYLRDPETGALSLDAAGGVPVESEKEFGECPFLQLLRSDTSEPTILNSVAQRTEPQFSAFKRARISAAIIIPLVAKERNLGLLCFATWTREVIGRDEADLVTTIAQFLATALDRDNTSQQLHRAKEQLGQHAQLLEQKVHERTARLEETISELETFSYTIAHDLRAPVRAMTGYCEVLLQDLAEELPPDAHRLVSRIARASERMDSLTRDLLEFSRVSRQEVALAPVQLEPIIDDLTALRGHTVRAAIQVRSPLLPVRGHRGLLQHVFANLVDNAVKFVQPGATPRIYISTEPAAAGYPHTSPRNLIFSATHCPPEPDPARPIELSANRVRIWIADEGIGIPREAHHKIFGIFERGVSDTNYEGTGIGLAIVARAMQRMGGAYGVESEPGKGSRFWLELPGA